MADNRDTDRRAEDIRLAEAVTDLTDRFDVHKHTDLEANVEELAVALLGPMKSKLYGNGRDTQQGLVWKFEHGGVKLNWSTWTKIGGGLLVGLNIIGGVVNIWQAVG